MGTNYYLHTDFCPCCGKPRKEIHLGSIAENNVEDLYMQIQCNYEMNNAYMDELPNIEEK